MRSKRPRWAQAKPYHSRASLLGHSPLRGRQLAAEGAALFRPTFAVIADKTPRGSSAATGRTLGDIARTYNVSSIDHDFAAHRVNSPNGIFAWYNGRSTPLKFRRQAPASSGRITGWSPIR